MFHPIDAPLLPSSRAARRLVLALAASLLLTLGLGAKWQAPDALRPRLAPHALTVNGRAAPLDLDVTPRFGWQSREPEQAAYEIRVASTRALAASGVADVWTSGKVASRVQHDVRYEGPALAPAQRYFWSVRTWGTRGEAWVESELASFGTGPGSSWTRSTPIWAESAGTSWSDYTLVASVTIDEVALGLRFRAPDLRNGYMWQLRGADNRLVPHRLVAGTFSVIESVALPPGTLALGRPARVVIEARGSTLRTFIDDVLVHTLEDATFPAGGVGVRTGLTESGSLAALTLVDDAGTTLLESTFAPGDRSFACGRVEGAALRVARASHCLNAGLAVDWAFLRTERTLPDEPLAWATLYATGASHRPAKQYVYKAYVNGQFVGLGPTHSIGSETRYDGFDVSALLRPGAANSIAAVAYTTEGQAFQAELVLGYADGRREVLGTDGNWRALSGDLALPAAGSIGTGYYAAPRENVDARHYPSGFDRPGFDDSTWPAARARPGLAELAAAPMAKVEEQLHAPLRIVEKAPGHYFVDFGRTWVGGVRYDVGAGSAGDTVELRFGEVTSAPDTVRHPLAAGNTYQDVYTLAEGAQTFRTWGMRVFRYLEVVGAPEPITSDNLAALALVHPLGGAPARFSAADPRLEQVWQLSRDTIEAVNVNFYTDSWTRERTNYEADAYLQLSSSAYLTNDLSLGSYSLAYFEQNRTWPSEWPLYVILGVHDAWQQNGALEPLLGAFEALKSKLPEAWFEGSTQLVRKTQGSNDCDSRTDCDIVDWPRAERDGYVFREYNTVLNALSYRAYRDMAAIAEAVGEQADALYYGERADALRAAINARLFVPELGRYDDGMDASGALTGHHALHASAFALAFGVPEDDQAPRVADYVASRGMACSVYCAPFLLNGLYRAGRAQAALELLTSSATSSWLNMIALGAGATAEVWDPARKSDLSYSHPWAATPAFVIPASLFGIQPLQPGYATFSVRPQPGALERAAIRVPTVRGTIGVAFEQDDAGALSLAVEVPGNTRASVSIPVAEGATTLYVDGAPRPLEVDASHARPLELGSGCHIVSPAPLAAAALERLLAACTSAWQAAPEAGDMADGDTGDGDTGDGDTRDGELDQGHAGRAHRVSSCAR